MLTGGRPPGSLYTSVRQRKYLTSAERVHFLEAAYACPRADLRTLCLTLALLKRR
jgi:integrase/recombinase XerD